MAFYLPFKYAGDGRPGNHSPFLASTLRDEDDEAATGLTESSRWSLPEDPERNLDRAAHGRNTAAEA